MIENFFVLITNTFKLKSHMFKCRKREKKYTKKSNKSDGKTFIKHYLLDSDIGFRCVICMIENLTIPKILIHRFKNLKTWIFHKNFFVI